MLSFDSARVPFSQRGSNLKITSFKRASGRPMISCNRGIPLVDQATRDNPSEYYEIALYRGEVELRADVRSTPVQLEFLTEAGTMKLTALDVDTYLFDADPGLTVAFLPVHSVCNEQWRDARQCAMVDYRGLCIHIARAGEDTELRVERGTTVTGTVGPYNDTPRTISFSSPGGGRVKGALRLSECGETWNGGLPHIDAACAAMELKWEQWRSRMPCVPPELESAAESAWYILWGCMSPRQGLYTREAVLASTHWFNGIFAWDNCFSALGLAEADPKLAIDQMRILFDRQAPNGLIPDPLTEFVSHFGYIKPPIYGWALKELRRELGDAALRPFLGDLYAPIAALTRWWFKERDTDADGMCEYLSGMDSGWDNATPWDNGMPVEGVDLAAYLVLQCEALAWMAGELGRDAEATEWAQTASRQLTHLLEQGMDGDHFRSVRNHQSAGGTPDTGSLLDRLPVMLGERIPDSAWNVLVEDLRVGGGFLTEHGLATQHIASSTYAPKGYWRGPIWAASTYLIFSGLRDRDPALAATVAERFCRMAARDGVMWENYDALTGQGQDCPAMAWTAAVFIRLAHWLASEGEYRSVS